MRFTRIPRALLGASVISFSLLAAPVASADPASELPRVTAAPSSSSAHSKQTPSQRVLNASLRESMKGNPAGSKNVELLKSMTPSERAEFDRRVEAGEYEFMSVPACADGANMESPNAVSSALLQSVPTTTQAYASPSLRVTATCDKTFTVLGVELARVRLEGVYYSSSYGAKVDRTVASNGYLVNSMDPTIADVTFSNAHHRVSGTNTAYFDIYVNVKRQVGWYVTNKGNTLQMTANGYQIVQSCRFA